MGQIPQDGNFGQIVSYLKKKQSLHLVSKPDNFFKGLPCPIPCLLIYVPIIWAELGWFETMSSFLLFKSKLFQFDTVVYIPDICHLDHLHVGGEEICHVEKFQISIHGISPHEEEFQFFHTTDVEKCEFLPNLVKFHIPPQDRCEEI